MKKLFYIILLSMANVFALGAQSNPSQEPTQPKPSERKYDYQTLRRSMMKGNANRPLAPSRLTVLFAYDGGICHFILNETISSISVTMVNTSTDEAYMGFVDAECCELDIELSIGEYYMECIADDGSIYSGYVTI